MHSMMQKIRDIFSFGAGLVLGLIAGGIAATWLSSERSDDQRSKLKDAAANFEQETQAHVQHTREKIQSSLADAISDRNYSFKD